MRKATSWLRNNIGIIVSSIGMVLLVILTFGDIGELFTDAYWQNVGGNISSISALTVGLVMIQVTIKQGVGEQALSAGLNTETTKKKYEAHKALNEKCRDKMLFLPYFLSIRNKRETIRRRKEFIVDNGFTSEKTLYMSGNKRLIKAYEKIQTNITVDSIKWSTTEIVYNKNGRIEKLDEFRKKRAVRAVITGFLCMFASTLIAGGLFLDTYNIPFWQKLVKLLAYIIIIAFTVVFDVGRNYEKGAFGVPNELDEINGIWQEFCDWKIPQWVIDEVEKNCMLDVEVNENNIHSDGLDKQPNTDESKNEILEEDSDEQNREENVDIGTGLQEEQEKIGSV